MPFYPQSVANQGACPNFVLFCCFHFKLAFEYVEEVGSASRGIGALVKLDLLIREF
jgi:hypothetical protein